MYHRRTRANEKRIPSWVVVTAAVIAALPFGWGLAVLAAYLLTAGRIGQLPALTVPLAIIGSIAFTLSRSLSPGMPLTSFSSGPQCSCFWGASSGRGAARREASANSVESERPARAAENCDEVAPSYVRHGPLGCAKTRGSRISTEGIPAGRCSWPAEQNQ
jgi:hypothetical protein